MHDGQERLARFIAAMREEKVDFIVQLGDFCVPHERNRGFLAEWQRQAPEKDYPRATTRPAISDWSGALWDDVQQQGGRGARGG